MPKANRFITSVPAYKTKHFNDNAKTIISSNSLIFMAC